MFTFKKAVKVVKDKVLTEFIKDIKLKKSDGI